MTHQPRAEDLFAHALELSPEERGKFLDQRCGGDTQLRAEVESLLRWHELADAENWELPAEPDPRTSPALANIRARTLRRAGPFELQEFLGEGATGIVYRALDTRSGRIVAVKIASPKTIANPANRDRFLRAAEAAMRIEHPRIARILETGSVEGLIYVVLEYVEGRTLAEVLKINALDRPACLRIARQMADALDAAHRHGIIHRDLKPANIMLDRAGDVKILDFGLCHVFTGTESIARTETGVALGTLGYMAPEQARGETPTPQTDLFSFGAVLYEMIAGQPAFRGETPVAILSSVLNDRPKTSGVSSRLMDLALWCLEKEPSRRPESAARVFVEITKIEKGGASIALRSRRVPRRVRVLVAASFLTLAVAFVLSSLLAHRGRTLTVQGLTRLTSGSGLTMSPALSKDGTMLAYASDRESEGNLHIWIQHMSGSQPVRLTSGPTNDDSPSFSPDGRTIAYRSERDGGGIYLIPVSGGEPVKLAPLGRRPRFSPDGKWIAYWIGTDAVGVNQANFPLPGSAKIYFIPAAGGSPQQLRSDFAAASHPVWTPDGNHILFLGNRDPNLTVEPPDGVHPGNASVDWWVMPLSGGPAVATGANAAFRAMGLASISQAPEQWMNDQPSVLMSAQARDSHSLWRIPISRETWKISGPPQRLTFGTTMDVQPAVSGKNLVFASLSGYLDVWGLPIDANHAQVSGALQRLTTDAFDHIYPSVSLDGSKIAYSSRRSGTRDIWVKSLETGKEAAVSVPPDSTFASVFSPDGARVAYRSLGAQGGSVQIAWLANNTHERVAECSAIGGWSSDGRALLCIGTSPARIYALDIGSRRAIGLLNHSSWLLWNPRFAPDNRWISFNATAPGRSRVFIAPFRSDGPIPESEWISITDGIWDDKPRWSPDGDALYFLSDRDGFRCIWAQGLDATKHLRGEAIPIFHLHEARRSLLNVQVGALDMSVARDKIVFNMHERSGNVWTVKLVDTK